MTFDQNDPKWTAYAFDELDADERAKIETELSADSDARQFINDLRRTGEVLRNALSWEPAPELMPAQRDAIGASLSQAPALDSPKVVRPAATSFVGRHRHWITVLGAVAASGVIVALVLPAIQSAREVAKKDTKKLSATATRSTSMRDESFKQSTKASREKSAATASVEAIDRAESARGASLVELTSSPDERGEAAKPSGSTGAAGRLNTSFAQSLPADSRSVDTIHKESDAALPVTKLSAPAAEDKVSNERRSFGAGYGGRRISEAEVASSTDAFKRTETGSLTVSDPRESRERQVVIGPAGGFEPALPLADREGDQLQVLATATPGGEAYDLPPENPFEPVAQTPLSTFSIDVDTASYANVRRFMMQNNQLPPPAAVRIEELINYFRYDYPQPQADVPFSVTTEVATCPWNTDHRLVRVGLKGKEVAKEKRPVSNLVFLLDVSGSMQPANKLPLVREAMKLLVRELSENDRVAIVVYAGASGLVLDSTTGDQKDAIIAAIENLQAGGSTNGAGGLQQAYDVAMQNFIKGGTNRVILATDGDFNVGITDRNELVKLITERAKSGVFLTTLGFGMGNLKDATLEQLADKGNGNYAYVDSLAEAKKVFVEEMTGTLVTIAKDVKVQIEFNPAEVESYRLIGYENRRLAAEDFNDDKKDAGEIGAGHTVTALYELVPTKNTAGQASSGTRAEDGTAGSTSSALSGNQQVDPLRYQKATAPKVDLTEAANTGELFTLKLRYKEPDGDTSKLIEHPLKDSGKAYREASSDFKFAASVAAFGMTLRQSQHRGTITLEGIKELALEGRSFDPGGYRSEFFTLIDRAAALGAK